MELIIQDISTKHGEYFYHIDENENVKKHKMDTQKKIITNLSSCLG